MWILITASITTYSETSLFRAAILALEMRQFLMPTASSAAFCQLPIQTIIPLFVPGAAMRRPRSIRSTGKPLRNRGTKKANLQLFPGDRIYVGRNAIVKNTVELNRLSEPVSLMLGQISA